MKGIIHFAILTLLAFPLSSRTCGAEELFVADNNEGAEIKITQDNNGEYFWTDNDGKYKILSINGDNIEFERDDYKLKYVIGNDNHVSCLKTKTGKPSEPKRHLPIVNKFGSETIEYHAVKYIIDYYQKGQIASRDE